MARQRALPDKQFVLDAAIELVASEGTEALTMRTLANRLNVASMTVYNYIENIREVRKGIAGRVFNQIYREAFAAFSLTLREGKPLTMQAACRLIGETVLRYATANENLYLFIFARNATLRSDSELAPFYRLFTQLIVTPDKVHDKMHSQALNMLSYVLIGLINEILLSPGSLSQAEALQQIDTYIEKMFD